MNILVSACLLGLDCRYCGSGCASDAVLALRERHHLIPVCPEQLGGLSTPRPPAELSGGRVVTRDGADVTGAFEKGAQQTLRLTELLGCDIAVLKSRSPSCGHGLLYDGGFSGRLVEGDGVTARLLISAGIPVYNEDNCRETDAPGGPGQA